MGQAHQVLQHRRVLTAAGQQRADGLAQVIVGRDQADARHVRAALDGDVAERGIGVDPHAGFFRRFCKAGLLPQGFHQRDALLPLDGAGAVGQDALFFKGHAPVFIANHVAAVGHVPGLQADAAGRRLHGSTASEIRSGVAAEDRQDRRIAAGGHPLGHVFHIAHLAPGGQSVDAVLFGGLQRRFPAQGLHGVIRHTVADDEDILHGADHSFCSRSRTRKRFMRRRASSIFSRSAA